MQRDEGGDGLYLYGVVRSSAPHEFTTRGLGERSDLVRTLHYEDLAAIVSSSPVVEYEGTRRNLLAHTRVLEEVMQTFTLLPVRFGVVAPNEAAIIGGLLRPRATELRTLLDQLEGKIELGLKAFWFEAAIFATILEENPAIRALRDRLAGRSPEETYYERISLGEQIEAAMAAKREADAAIILERLRPIVEQVQVSPALTDRMVVNAAFLLARSREPEFDAAIQALDRDLGSRMMFKYVGPVPPYNFVNVALT